MGADIDGTTMHFIMKDALDYNKYLACVKSWLPDYTKEWRAEWTITMLDCYSKPKDWYQVQFSDEVHFGYGLEG